MTQHRKLIDGHITAWVNALPKGGLYTPMGYLMGLPAKRVRPALVLMGCELFDGRAEDALDEALGIELFHNFTLMHDDIMDAAPLRRGQPTVHEKWNVNTAILSGDAMLVKAYQLMAKRPDVSAIFSRYALEVCEGQQLDMEFERRDDVTTAEYTAMIRQKTAVLLACALRVGAAVAGASKEDSDRIGAFGEHTGLAFQLRDDLLDAFGDPAKTGKQQGGDLRAGKKTFLLIRGLELSATNKRNELQKELAKPADQRDVPRMLQALEELGVRDEAEHAIQAEDRKAVQALDAIAVPEERKEPLRALSAQLMARSY
ncbi:MAG: polyprenyl synthetase family protein [Flavobacteriales bacterium]|nr:polyprenyl synthetase family protein [Flavobacteriales bacterium]MBK7249070.1 polyprenyl synthetase family protein [Flavobacteriales bacterium]MBK7285646.1 polyprenyl synthetase family protein [Flavobacteriales bacterium]MBK9058680.1 polyprenyl synthetase family protein [Flavobacteriales bacterium]QQS71317.1 MAG: polyprenyl synthetase family protein [Flavobacteriales bacterium]